VRLRNANESPLDVPAIVWLRSLSLSINISSSALSGEAVFRGVRPGQYTVEAEAPGYATARETIELWSSGGISEVTVYMRAEPAAKTAASPPGPPVLAPKARKEVEKGLQALQANNLAEARKHLEAALRLAPGHPDVNYLFGALSLQANEPAQAERFLEKAVTLDPKHRFALLSLSELHYRQQEYAEAVRLLERALQLDLSSWQAHWLIACAYFRQREFEKARDHAERALKSGKEKAGEAQILLGQALAALGEKEKASQALESFLRDYPAHPAAGQARRLLGAMREQAKEPTRLTALSVLADANAIAPFIAPAMLPAPASRWAPADVDTTVPAVALDTPCSLPEVLSTASGRVKELVTNLQQFTATEWLEHGEMDDSGKVYRRETRTFTYLAGIEQIRPGMLSVDEYRNGGASLDAFPGRLATMGLAALALIFHPYYVDDFEMTCEGLGQWRGQPAWQVYFRQRSDRPSRIRTYRVKHIGYPVKLKGRAWIAAGTDQIVRLETDLLEQISAIRLLMEHLVIEYRAVQFQKRREELWLPESAELHFDFEGHRYHRRHSFSDFQLFSVDTSQQIQQPPTP
jgi:tetratricopeptide (TPR) repeat protein